MERPVDSGRAESSMQRIPDADLVAYVEGRLDKPRRAAIEGFLACNPDLAASIMQALHLNARARLELAPPPRVSRMARTTRLLAACFACAVAGWAVAEGLDDDGPFRDLSPTPEYVDDALMSQRVTRMRVEMESQHETTLLDAHEIERTTGILLPVLSGDSDLLDAQVYPSEDGPSVNVLLRTPAGHRLNLFAVRADTSVTAKPVTTTQKGAYAAYWEVDGAAYVLTGDAPDDEILVRAAQLSRASQP